MDKLSKIAKTKDTDKGLDKHGYTKWYEPFFAKYKNPKILEIGVLNGGSIYMYNDYYKGNCEIWCADIYDKSSLFKDMPNVHFVQLDQSRREEWDKFLNEIGDLKFDIIIDDGSHLHQHQMVTLSKLHKTVGENGLYILEDLHTSTWETKNYANAPLTYLSFFGFLNSPYLDENENNELKKSIKDVQILNIKTSGNFNMEYRQRSITSIITFN